ncbi:MAG: malate synthase G, partial [Gammaproteobacteria bacterium]
MTERVAAGGLKIAKPLFDLVADEIAPGSGIDATDFWVALGGIVADLGPKNRALLEKRDSLQQAIDNWHKEREGKSHDAAEYKNFLSDIGYLVPEGDDFQVAVEKVDAEVAQIAGPQLVVPVQNARYALNAANARWGSLYDALYGTDVIPEDEGAARSGAYNPVRGQKVVERAAEFLDQVAPLTVGGHGQAVSYALIGDGKARALAVTLADGTDTHLQDTSRFAGYLEDGGTLSTLLLRNHELHVELHFDPAHPVGKTHPAGIKDVVLESAITT